jgi:hypothetical protein
MSQVFLTYSLKDEREAAGIREELCRHGLRIWWDAELPPGKEWAYEVGAALESSESMIVLVSPHSMDSDLVQRELGYAISHANYRNRLFPVIIEPTRKIPGYFSKLQVFDITKERTRGLRKLAQAIQAAG